ncbi:hypothetical protein, partial [Hydrogenivirga sp. 128-5-R1-1]|uniref:c-type cytochrome biogenesis protein CcmI/CycH n=1 Tax=Hydrogenivirga sp. 128-5-R1-1 TaxID=392423 RepID=UPI00015F3A9D
LLLTALGIFITACQELPPEAYLIDKYKIQGQVYIDDKIKNQCKGTLFIIVRKGSTPQPLAVKKLSNPDFPYDFTITPADVLIPQRANEFDGQLILMARVSKTGSPMPKKGDCESDAMVINAGDKNIKLLIKNIVK